MPDFELDAESISRAEDISAELLNEVELAARGSRSDAHFSDKRYERRSDGVPVSDVVSNVSLMADEFAIARVMDANLPCLMFGDRDVSPISITTLVPPPSGRTFGSKERAEFWQEPDNRRLWHELHNQLIGGGVEGRIISWKFERAASFIKFGLTQFLSFRFAGIKTWHSLLRAQGMPVVGPDGGLQMRVSCRTPGLRMHISPAYFINWTFFGAPTTPVSSYVLPGRYVFAADGPRFARWIRDPGIFAVPPTYEAFLTSF
jgi:hypothetical protein